jgi:hypothetical protein
MDIKLVFWQLLEKNVFWAKKIDSLPKAIVNRTESQSYSVFHRFKKAKFAYGGSILSSSQFSILPQLPQKMKLASKVVKIDPKIIVSLPKL